MIKLKQDQKNTLMQQTQTIVEQAEESKSTREIMAAIYVENLDNKTIEQGLMMADAIIESVAAFDNKYAEAKSDIDKWLDKELNDIAADMSLNERCTLWLKIAAAVSMSNEELKKQGVFDDKTILDKIESLQISEDQATVELEEQLYTSAKDVIENSNIMLSVIAEQNEALKNAEDEYSVAEILIGFGSREIDFRAIASMMAYTNVKNGSFDNVPIDVKLEQLTTVVCATVEEIRIADAVAKEEMDVDTAKTFLKILGTITLLAMLPPTISIGALIVISIIKGYQYLPKMEAMCMVMLAQMKKGVEWCDRETARLVEQSSVSIKNVINSLAIISASIKETILPKVTAIIKNIWDRIRSVLGMVTESQETVEQTETQETEEEFVADMEWVND